MNLLDWAAIVGALAWVPPIVGLVNGWITKPELRILTQPAPELSFALIGPICNLRLAFSVRHKDLVITGIKLKLAHESGEEHLFAWHGLVQQLGQFRNPQVGHLPFEKESGVLALKVVTNSIEERSIRFQEPAFIRGRAAPSLVANKKLAYLKQQGDVDYPRFIGSQEMTDLFSFIRQSFFWKPGTYKLTFIVESPQQFKIVGDQYEFTLSSPDVSLLEANKTKLEAAALQQVTDQPAEVPPVQWNWVFPDMQAKS